MSTYLPQARGVKLTFDEGYEPYLVCETRGHRVELLPAMGAKDFYDVFKWQRLPGNNLKRLDRHDGLTLRDALRVFYRFSREVMDGTEVAQDQA